MAGRVSLTQPVCENRFFMLKGEIVAAYRINIPESEWDSCCFCGRPTNIYYRFSREEAEKLPYPRREKD